MKDKAGAKCKAQISAPRPGNWHGGAVRAVFVGQAFLHVMTEAPSNLHVYEQCSGLPMRAGAVGSCGKRGQPWPLFKLGLRPAGGWAVRATCCRRALRDYPAGHSRRVSGAWKPEQPDSGLLSAPGAWNRF